jgi:hypothetical protein
MAGSGGSQTGSALRKWKRGGCHPLKKKGQVPPLHWAEKATAHEMIHPNNIIISE